MAKVIVNKSYRQLSENLKLNRRTISRVIQRKFKPKRVTTVDEAHVKDFYKREDISRLVPSKRYATMQGPGYLMQVSIGAAHSKYLAENPTKKVSSGKFASLRPKYVRKLSQSHREYCCCVYCVNVRYKLLALSRPLKDSAKKKTNEHDINAILLCPISEAEKYHKPHCIDGSCNSCSDYLTRLEQYYEEIPRDQVLKWSHWERSDVNGKPQKVIVNKTGTKNTLLQELVEKDIKKPAQGINFFQHVHNAKWQNAQFSKIKNELPDMQLDITNNGLRKKSSHPVPRRN
jgi:hypothetical protein